MGQLYQIVRFEMMQQLGSNYVLTARAKGVREARHTFQARSQEHHDRRHHNDRSDYAKQIGG
jgi:hypothetical protein